MVRVAPKMTLFDGILMNSPPAAWQRLKQQHRLEVPNPNCITSGEGCANFLHISEIIHLILLSQACQRTSGQQSPDLLPQGDPCHEEAGFL